MITFDTVERAQVIAAEAAEVAGIYLEQVDKARDNYVDAPAAAKADAWRNYTHAMDQLAHANYRAGEAAKLHKAVANTYHLAQAWDRLSRQPVELHAVPVGLVQ